MLLIETKTGLGLKNIEIPEQGCETSRTNQPCLPCKDRKLGNYYGASPVLGWKRSTSTQAKRSELETFRVWLRGVAILVRMVSKSMSGIRPAKILSPR